MLLYNHIQSDIYRSERETFKVAVCGVRGIHEESKCSIHSMFSLKYNHLKLRIMCFLKLWMSPSYLQERLLFMEFHEQPCFYRLNTGSRETSLFYIIWLTWKGRETICSLITRDWILHTAPLRIDPCSRTQSHSYLLSLYCDTWYGLMWSTPSLVRTQMSMLLPEARSFMTPAWMAARTSSFALSSWELQEFREMTEREIPQIPVFIICHPIVTEINAFLKHFPYYPDYQSLSQCVTTAVQEAYLQVGFVPVL